MQSTDSQKSESVSFVSRHSFAFDPAQGSCSKCGCVVTYMCVWRIIMGLQVSGFAA
jgi:hypothetical protein